VVRGCVWCREGRYVEASLAYLVVGGPKGREYGPEMGAKSLFTD
jgi:hypothetical protein